MECWKDEGERLSQTERKRERPSFANFPLPATHETSHHTHHYISLLDFNCEDPAASVDFRHLFSSPPLTPLPSLSLSSFTQRGKEVKCRLRLVMMVRNGCILVTLSLSVIISSAAALLRFTIG